MIFNSIFNHIYVINLKESVDRKAHITNEFKRVGIEKYQFFEATPYYADEVKELMKSNLVKKFPNCFRCNKKRCDCENNYLTPYQIGNWCSFINLFKDMIKNDHKFVLICEDDIVFSHQYERIINTLLSPSSFKTYRINMNAPLLIRMGTAFNPDNHNSRAPARFLKNYSLCNPCFAINKEMAMVYLKYLKVIDYHSDVYFHQKIPKNIPGIQFFTMYPYPIYELSFVKSKQKFESLVRPSNGFSRRMEYKEFLFLSSNLLLHFLLKRIVQKFPYDIKDDKIGHHGNIDYYILMDEMEKAKYYFEYKILLVDNEETDIKMLENNISLDIYKLYQQKFEELYGKDEEDLIMNAKAFYKKYMKLMDDIPNLIKINVNNVEQMKFLNNFINPSILNQYINEYTNIRDKTIM